MKFFLKSKFDLYAKDQPIVFEKSPHCNLVESEIKKIKARYLLQRVSGRDYPSKIAFERSNDFTIIGSDPAFSKSFAQALDGFDDDVYIQAERNYILQSSQYRSFKNSPFYLDLKAELNSFFSGQCHGSSFDINTIGSMYIPHGSRRGSFFLDFYTFDYHRGPETESGDSYVLMMDKNYRALDTVENSMLAVALAEDYPIRFSMHFKVLLTEASLNLFLYPIFIPFGIRPIIPQKGMRDLY